MFEQMKERLDELRKKWWFGKWASIAYAGSLILFAIYCQMQEGTLGQKVLLVLLGVCFCSGLILAYLQNSKPVRKYLMVLSVVPHRREGTDGKIPERKRTG